LFNTVILTVHFMSRMCELSYHRKDLIICRFISPYDCTAGAIAFVLVEFTQNALRCSPLPAFGAVFGPLGQRPGCRSFVGRQDGGQKLSLQKNGCLYGSTVQHEVLHALGFNHEQVRSDRDNYVSIHYENIGEGKIEHNFDKKKTNNLGTPYDFTSVMQYPNDAFSKNGKPTIVAKSDPKMKFGHAAQLSVNDIIRVNKLYKCCKEKQIYVF
uniref:Metalloendopeptidase n=1 Tax=Xiphophorus couchianus TaxID=32473 RepID=A0A3B5KY69_9TELE